MPLSELEDPGPAAAPPDSSEADAWGAAGAAGAELESSSSMAPKLAAAPASSLGAALAQPQWLKTFVSGAGFMSDAYDLFVIDVVKNVMSQLYPQSTGQASAVSTAALVGAVMGQLVFGALADRLGRRVIFMVTLVLVVFGALGSTTSGAQSALGASFGVYEQLAVWRFILGFGVGGEYPLSATITSEGAAARTRGYAISLVFAMQGVGKILAAAINAICISSGMPLDSAWRFALGFGAVPGLLTVYWRWKIEESHHFKAVVAADNAPATSVNPMRSRGGSAGGGAGADGDSPFASPVSVPSLAPAPAAALRAPDGLVQALAKPKTSDFRKTLATIFEFRYVLLGTAGTWFLLDITFYGQGLFSGTVLSIAGITSSSGSRLSTGDLTQLALGSLMLVCIAMPGYIVGCLTIERMGRKPMQLMGFSVCAALFLVLGVFYREIREQRALFVLLYGLTFFFSNFGANLTTFVVPAEAFPTRARATCHGISAASGKLGAVLGSSGMAPLLTVYGMDAASKERGLQLVMYVCCAVSALGLVWTLLFTQETGGKSLDLLDQRDPSLARVVVPGAGVDASEGAEAAGGEAPPRQENRAQRAPAADGAGRAERIERQRAALMGAPPPDAAPPAENPFGGR